jgi:hypothetical protein
MIVILTNTFNITRMARDRSKHAIQPHRPLKEFFQP